MADENQPEPKQRVRYNMAVTVDGVTHPAKTYEVEVVQSAAKALVASGRATVVNQQPPAPAAAAPVALTPQQVAAVAAALTQPAAQPEAQVAPAPVTPAPSAASAAPPKS